MELEGPFTAEKGGAAPGHSDRRARRWKGNQGIQEAKENQCSHERTGQIVCPLLVMREVKAEKLIFDLGS